MKSVLRRHLFLCIGVVSLSLFFLAGALDRPVEYHATQTLPYHPGSAQQVSAAPSATAHETLAAAVRALIVPMYLVWMLMAMVQVALAGPYGLPQPLATLVSGFSLLSGLAPYALVDYILVRFRRSREQN